MYLTLIEYDVKKNIYTLFLKKHVSLLFNKKYAVEEDKYLNILFKYILTQ